MSDHDPWTPDHADAELLTELALGELSADQVAAATGHLASCSGCRAAYADIAEGVDRALLAAPPSPPPAGFETRVLERIKAAARPAPAYVRRRGRLLVAAALVIGVALGGGLGAWLREPAPPRPDGVAAAVAGVPMANAAGRTVGSVQHSRYDGDDVLVMDVVDAPAGRHLVCRLTLAGGRSETTGGWTVPTDGHALWIVTSRADVRRVELVGDDGTVWSGADLAG